MYTLNLLPLTALDCINYKSVDNYLNYVCVCVCVCVCEDYFCLLSLK